MDKVPLSWGSSGEQSPSGSHPWDMGHATSSHHRCPSETQLCQGEARGPWWGQGDRGGGQGAGVGASPLPCTR